MAEIPEARTPAEDYRRHLADITWERAGQKFDPSRVDAEIAVRMRVTGHHEDEIVRAMKEAGLADRRGETRDWDAYAKRAVAVAFGVPGDISADTSDGRLNDFATSRAATAMSRNDYHQAARSPVLDLDANSVTIVGAGTILGMARRPKRTP